MYDMYPWDQPAATPDRAAEPAQAVQAVQVALDRRDNGGAPNGRRGESPGPRQADDAVLLAAGHSPLTGG
jgi:hypothetical protein